jgi:hypothetical protein
MQAKLDIGDDKAPGISAIEAAVAIRKTTVIHTDGD